MTQAQRQSPTPASYPFGVDDDVDGVLVNQEIVSRWARDAEWLSSIGGTVNDLTATCADAGANGVVALPAYSKGKQFILVPASPNTGGMTVNIDGLGVRTIADAGGATLQGGAVAPPNAYLLLDDGTKLRVMFGVGSSSLGG